MWDETPIDTFGAPEFFSDTLGAIEDAGSGMVRIVRCVKRRGLLIPVFSCITPAEAMLKDGPKFREVCLKIIGARVPAH